MRRVFGTAASLVLLAVAACGGSSVPTAAGQFRGDGRTGKIVNGTATGSSYGNVGAVMFDFAGDGLDHDDWFCTGSLISPTVFLTAAHCLEFLPANAQIYVSFEPAVSDGAAGKAKAVAFHFDPAYGHDNSDPHDIGVVILPSSSTKGLTPFKLPTAGYLDDAKVQNGLKGDQFLNIGYGGDVNRTGTPTITYD